MHTRGHISSKQHEADYLHPQVELLSMNEALMMTLVVH